MNCCPKYKMESKRQVIRIVPPQAGRWYESVDAGMPNSEPMSLSAPTAQTQTIAVQPSVILIDISDVRNPLKLP